MAHLGHAALHCVEYFQCRHQFARAENLDGQAPTAHLADDLRQVIGAGAQPRKVPRPGGDHFPLERLFCCGARAVRALGGVRLLSAGRHQSGSAGDARAHDEFSAIHGALLFS